MDYLQIFGVALFLVFPVTLLVVLFLNRGKSVKLTRSQEKALAAFDNHDIWHRPFFNSPDCPHCQNFQFVSRRDFPVTHPHAKHESFVPECIECRTYWVGRGETPPDVFHDRSVAKAKAEEQKNKIPPPTDSPKPETKSEATSKPQPAAASRTNPERKCERIPPPTPESAVRRETPSEPQRPTPFNPAYYATIYGLAGVLGAIVLAQVFPNGMQEVQGSIAAVPFYAFFLGCIGYAIYGVYNGAMTAYRTVIYNSAVNISGKTIRAKFIVSFNGTDFQAERIRAILQTVGSKKYSYIRDMSHLSDVDGHIESAIRKEFPKPQLANLSVDIINLSQSGNEDPAGLFLGQDM